MEYSNSPFHVVDSFVDRFGFKDEELTEETVDYRMSLLREEYQETDGAHRVNNVEELIDGHVDIIVVALGNLAIFGVNGRKAFDEVMRANMSKEKGKRRESDPDGQSIIKPLGWVGPNHEDNHGQLDEIYPEE